MPCALKCHFSIGAHASACLTACTAAATPRHSNQPEKGDEEAELQPLADKTCGQQQLELRAGDSLEVSRPGSGVSDSGAVHISVSSGSISSERIVSTVAGMPGRACVSSAHAPKQKNCFRAFELLGISCASCELLCTRLLGACQQSRSWRLSSLALPSI